MADTYARMGHLLLKADELCNKGHVLRAAEYYGRAADETSALGPDNLVALRMRLRQGAMYCAHVLWEDNPAAAADPLSLAAHCVECVTLFSGAVAALERRRVAGTLLEGKCAAPEVAWRVSDLQRLNPGLSAADAAGITSFLGYDEYMRAAGNVVDVLTFARYFAAACSRAQFQTFAEFVVLAAELMQQPRRDFDVALQSEAEFMGGFTRAVAEAGARGLDADLVQLLAGALQRLQSSGVLQVRRIEERIESIAPKQRALDAAIQKSLSASGLRNCALAGCDAKEAHPAHFKSCAACRAVVYCCREHQVAGWPGHKKACKAARKAAAAEEEDGAGPSGA